MRHLSYKITQSKLAAMRLLELADSEQLRFGSASDQLFSVIARAVDERCVALRDLPGLHNAPAGKFSIDAKDIGKIVVNLAKCLNPVFANSIARANSIIQMIMGLNDPSTKAEAITSMLGAIRFGFGMPEDLTFLDKLKEITGQLTSPQAKHNSLIALAKHIHGPAISEGLRPSQIASLDPLIEGISNSVLKEKTRIEVENAGKVTVHPYIPYIPSHDRKSRDLAIQLP